MHVGSILSKNVYGLDAIDIELLLTKVLGVTRANLKAYPERELTTAEQHQYEELLHRRMRGEPIAYLLGHREFWSLDFVVTPDVLIPRADTELLVELALERLEGKKHAKILDLGTGSGAIALSIAHAVAHYAVVATDVSPESLQVAQANARRLGILNVEFALGNWYEALDVQTEPKFNMIVSNPPYIAAFDPHLTQGDLRFEPNRALVAGPQGMDALSIVIAQAPQYLLPKGVLLVEHGYDQERLVAQQFAAAGFKHVQCFKDLAGIPRVSAGVWV